MNIAHYPTHHTRDISHHTRHTSHTTHDDATHSTHNTPHKPNPTHHSHILHIISSACTHHHWGEVFRSITCLVQCSIFASGYWFLLFFGTVQRFRIRLFVFWYSTAFSYQAIVFLDTVLCFGEA